jgi:hypothetical protein
MSDEKSTLEPELAPAEAAAETAALEPTTENFLREQHWVRVTSLVPVCYILYATPKQTRTVSFSTSGTKQMPLYPELS